MKKAFLLIILFVSTVLLASPLKEERAREIASGFFSSGMTRSGAAPVQLVWAGSSVPMDGKDMASVHNPDNALLYIYNSGSTDGFVVVSGESKAAPVIAFSHERPFDLHNTPTAAKALLDAWCRQIRSIREGSKTASERADDQGEPVEGNVVLNYRTALWGQGEPYNLEAPVLNGGRCVTGCVATAMAIIAFSNGYPSSGTGTVPEYSYGSVTIPAQKLGRKYDYDNMLLDYSQGYTDAEGKAVAALMKDMGVAVKMQYGVNESGTVDGNVLPALAEYFGYSKGALMLNAEGYYSGEWESMLMENIRKYGPTYYSGASDVGGHAFVLDGYTDKGYFSINFGWDGYGNGYYLIPYIEYYDDQRALLELVPDWTGTSSYRDLLAVIACYDKDKDETFWGLQAMSDSYKPGVSCLVKLSGIVNQSPVPFTGEVKISLCDASGNIKEDLCHLSVSDLEYCYTREFKDPIEIVIRKEINEGDRLMVFYKGQNSSQWHQARGYDTDSQHDVQISSSPEYVSEYSRILWSKSDRMMKLYSALPVQCVLEGNGRSVSVSSRPYRLMEMDLYDFPRGEYILKMTSGSDPYEVVIVL